MEATVSTIAIIVLFIAISIAVVKTIHFSQHIRHKKVRYWFYFDRLNIINSRNEQSEKAKKVQNIFTIVFGAIILLELVVLMVSKSL